MWPSHAKSQRASTIRIYTSNINHIGRYNFIYDLMLVSAANSH